MPAVPGILCPAFLIATLFHFGTGVQHSKFRSGAMSIYTYIHFLGEQPAIDFYERDLDKKTTFRGRQSTTGPKMFKIIIFN